MNVSDTLKAGGSFVLPGTRSQTNFQCAKCRSFDVRPELREVESILSIRLACRSCGNYIETELVKVGDGSSNK